MLDIHHYLRPQSTLAKAALTSQKRVLETLANLLAQNDENLCADTFAELIERERLGSTATGKGLAIPHARVPELESASIAVLTLEAPIEFKAPDDQKVDLFIALAVPHDATDEHLRLLQSLSELISRPKLCEHLRNCHTNDALYKTLLMAHVH